MATPLFTHDQTHHANLAQLAEIIPGAIVSKPLIDTGPVKQILFAIDRGQEISQHKAPFPATVHILDGRLRFGIANQDREMGPNDWVLMQPNESHDLTALEPTRFLLTLIKGE